MSEQTLDKNSFLFGLATGVAIVAVIGLLLVWSNTPVKPENKVEENQAQNSALSVRDTDHIKGDINAPITLLEFSDFQCPYCKKFHPTIQKVMKEYAGKVRWIYRHFPLSFHNNAQKTAESSECAGEQGKFWEYLDMLFENSQADGTGLNTEDLKKYASELGLDMNQFNNCVSSGKFAGKVKADMESGQKAGVTGTPGTFVIAENGDVKLIPGALPFSQVKSLLDEMLK